VVVTKGEKDESKPAPDIVVAATEELGLPAADCAMVGDTVYDAQACKAAGVVFLGVLSGGTPEAELLEAGAIAVWRDVGHLLQDLDRALEIASVAGATSN
jgi:phosphoglycolate phosphatase-like HAD superfamily hydrolase